MLVRRALALLDPRPGERVADFFCGLGNFTLPIARRGAHGRSASKAAPRSCGARRRTPRATASQRARAFRVGEPVRGHARERRGARSARQGAGRSAARRRDRARQGAAAATARRRASSTSRAARRRSRATPRCWCTTTATRSRPRASSTCSRTPRTSSRSRCSSADGVRGRQRTNAASATTASTAITPNVIVVPRSRPADVPDVRASPYACAMRAATSAMPQPFSSDPARASELRDEHQDQRQRHVLDRVAVDADRAREAAVAAVAEPGLGRPAQHDHAQRQREHDQRAERRVEPGDRHFQQHGSPAALIRALRTVGGTRGARGAGTPQSRGDAPFGAASVPPCLIVAVRGSAAARARRRELRSLASPCSRRRSRLRVPRSFGLVDPRHLDRLEDLLAAALRVVGEARQRAHPARAGR